MTSPDRDAGLQRERTDLAWWRTALSAAGCAALLVGVAARHQWATALVPAACVAVVAVVVGRRRSGADAARPVSPRTAATIAVLVVCACLSALPLVLG